MEHHQHYPVSVPTLQRVAGRLTTEVAVITVGSGRRPHGCVANRSRTPPELLTAGAFDINILPDMLESRSLCTLFAGKEPHKFTNAPRRLLPSGVPVLNAAMSWMDCRVVEVHESGDRIIVIGKVMAAEETHRDALVFYRGQYASPGRRADARSA